MHFSINRLGSGFIGTAIVALAASACSAGGPQSTPLSSTAHLVQHCDRGLGVCVSLPVNITGNKPIYWSQKSTKLKPIVATWASFVSVPAASKSSCHGVKNCYPIEEYSVKIFSYPGMSAEDAIATDQVTHFSRAQQQYVSRITFKGSPALLVTSVPVKVGAQITGYAQYLDVAIRGKVVSMYTFSAYGFPSYSNAFYQSVTPTH